MNRKVVYGFLFVVGLVLGLSVTGFVDFDKKTGEYNQTLMEEIRENKDINQTTLTCQITNHNRSGSEFLNKER